MRVGCCSNLTETNRTDLKLVVQIHVEPARMCVVSPSCSRRTRRELSSRRRTFRLRRPGTCRESLQCLDARVRCRVIKHAFSQAIFVGTDDTSIASLVVSFAIIIGLARWISMADLPNAIGVFIVAFVVHGALGVAKIA